MVWYIPATMGHKNIPIIRDQVDDGPTIIMNFGPCWWESSYAQVSWSLGFGEYSS
jgi:hypothetical protein